MYPTLFDIHSVCHHSWYSALLPHTTMQTITDGLQKMQTSFFPNETLYATLQKIAGIFYQMRPNMLPCRKLQRSIFKYDLLRYCCATIQLICHSSWYSALLPHTTMQTITDRLQKLQASFFPNETIYATLQKIAGIFYEMRPYMLPCRKLQAFFTRWDHICYPAENCRHLFLNVTFHATVVQQYLPHIPLATKLATGSSSL